MSLIQTKRTDKTLSQLTNQLEYGEPLFVNPATGSAYLVIGTGSAEAPINQRMVELTTGDDKSIYANETEISGLDMMISNAATQVGTTGKKVYLVGVQLDDSGNLDGSKFDYVRKGTRGVYIDSSTGVVHGSAWNDYAEYRYCNGEAGDVVVEVGSGILGKSGKKRQPGAYIVSDTFGFTIGEENADTRPVAVAGRVLAKANDREKLKVGDCVGTGPNGKVSRMNRLEVILYPDRVIGVVSEIPEGDSWNGINIENRIWVTLR